MRALPFLLLLSACDGPADGAKDASADTGDTGTDDTGKKDSGKDTDDTDDTDPDTDTDPNDTDTAGPLPAVDTGYAGLTLIAFLVDGAGGGGTNPSNVVLYDPVTGESSPVAGLTVRGDSVLDCAGDSVFVLETRVNDGLDDRVIRVDPTDGTYTEWVLGSNFQPRDVAWVMGNYWIANWGKARLSTYSADGVRGAFVTLTDHADGDGVPEANGLFVAGASVYVTLARQTAGTSNGARLIEVDPDDNTVVRSVDLEGTYPSGRMFIAADKVHVHHRSTGNGDGTLNPDGGLEAVALDTFESAGLTRNDADHGVRQTVATLDPFSVTAWFAWVSASGAPSVGAVSLLDGSARQSWAVPDSVAGLGLAEGKVWTAENPFAGGSGAVVGRSPADGAEIVRVAQAGVVRGMAVCVASTLPPEEGDDTGGE